MSDITVQKYQYYFSESVRLQEVVNEQAAYIEKLEAALLEMAQTAARKEEMKDKIRAARAAREAASKLADDNEGGIGYGDYVDYFHDQTSKLNALKRKDAKEKASEELYDKGGKIVKPAARKTKP